MCGAFFCRHFYPQQTAIRSNISQFFRRNNSNVFGQAKSGSLAPKIYYKPSNGPVDPTTLWRPIVFTASVNTNLNDFKIYGTSICSISVFGGNVCGCRHLGVRESGSIPSKQEFGGMVQASHPESATQRGQFGRDMMMQFDNLT